MTKTTSNSHSFRKYDVVLYGATGFVGKQTVAYFADLQNSEPELTWAIAGRSKDKLEAVKNAVGQGAKKAGVVVADAHDKAALDKLAKSTKVVLSTAGPFALYGTDLVEACVNNGTHYVDITGETPWVHGLIEKFHETAKKNSTRIIPFCGFDSVPSDLGTWLVAKTMFENYGEPVQSVKSAFSMRGGVNGGTLASMFNFLGSGKEKLLADPFLLNPQTTKPQATSEHRDPIAPIHDADFKAWLGPFFMGPINTRVVRRSAALLTSTHSKPRLYADDFHYQEYMRFGAGLLAGTAAAAFSAGMLTTQAALKSHFFTQICR